eukprot:Nk52_evm1s2171 gene=Nk52_evmTU1s2171
MSKIADPQCAKKRLPYNFVFLATTLALWTVLIVILTVNTTRPHNGSSVFSSFGCTFSASTVDNVNRANKSSSVPSQSGVDEEESGKEEVKETQGNQGYGGGLDTLVDRYNNININTQGLARFGILIQSTGNVGKTMGVLRDLYHPLNSYAIHVDSKTPKEDIKGIRAALEGDTEIQRNGNVVLMNSTSISYGGITMVTNVLSAMNTLLRMEGEMKFWNFFMHISTSDQRLLSIEDMMDIFGNVPTRINFLDNHLAERGFMEWRIQHGHVDEGMWGKVSRKAKLQADKGEKGWIPSGPYEDLVGKQYALAERKMEYYKKVNGTEGLKERKAIQLPEISDGDNNLFLYKGSGWMVLCRDFVEYVARPQTSHPMNILALLSRSFASDEFYFQTVAMGSREWRGTVANDDLRFDLFNDPFDGKKCATGTHACTIIPKYLPSMYASGALLARKFDISNAQSRETRKIIENGIKKGSTRHLKNVCATICQHLDNMSDSFKHKYVDMQKKMHSRACGTCEEFIKHPMGDPVFGKRELCSSGCSQKRACAPHCIPQVARLLHNSTGRETQKPIAVHDGTGRIICRSGLFPEHPALPNPFWEQASGLSQNSIDINNTSIQNFFEPPNICDVL